jgi:hypothetical protein
LRTHVSSFFTSPEADLWATAFHIPGETKGTKKGVESFFRHNRRWTLRGGGKCQGAAQKSAQCECDQGGMEWDAMCPKAPFRFKILSKKQMLEAFSMHACVEKGSCTKYEIDACSSVWQ